MSVETIRDIPVIVEHRRGCKADFEPIDFDHDYISGFPFDSSSRRTRDPLEDIAQRHPEFAQHLQGFPRRSQRTGGEQDDDEFLRRRFERPFSSGRFERFGFPFERDDFEREPQRYYQAYPEHFQNFQNQHPQSPPHTQSPQYQQSSSQTSQGQQYPPQYGQQFQPQSGQQSRESQPPSQHQQPQYQTQQSQSVSQGTQTEEACGSEEPQETNNGSQEQKSEGGQQARGRPIQQSNTCDLAQHQLPDEALNERGQRSMSAPPENKRFTSSVNIPMGGTQENNAGGVKSQTGSGSTERVIPIHVEGRDDPVIPKGLSGSASSQHHQPQPERVFSDGTRPQSEKIFGRRPDAFTQFVHRDPSRFTNDWPPSFGGFPEDEFGFRQTESPSRYATHQQSQQQQPSRQEPTPQPQEQKPSSQQRQPETTQHAPKQQQQQQPQGPIEQIQAIQKDVSTLLRQVEAFNGLPRDKNYLYLDEMLTRNLLKLDNVDTQGQDAIRSARKEAIKCIERTIGHLEAKAAANAASREGKTEVGEQSLQDEEKMETEGSIASQNASRMEMSPSPAQDETMEVTEASQESSNKNAKSQNSEQQSKSAENVENFEEQTKKEEEVKPVDELIKTQNQEVPGPLQSAESANGGEQANNEDAPKGEEDSGEKNVEVKEDEKKEKKKIKKKTNKEDKEKKH